MTIPKSKLIPPILILSIVAIVGLAICLTWNPGEPEPSVASEATTEQVREFCAACHAFPSPDMAPRSVWREHVEQGFRFYRDSKRELRAPSVDSVVAYYENRAPLRLPSPDISASPGPSPVRWETTGYAMPGRLPNPMTSNVSLVRLRSGPLPEVLVCECEPRKSQGEVQLLNPHGPVPVWKTLGKVPAPAHAEVVDLDGDGIKDIIVACLGSFFPTNEPVGSVVWLRGKPDGTFEPITLLSKIGRVADVQAADFNGDGKLDLVVAEFGWNTIGSILLLENQTTDWARPKFEKRVLDGRTGAIHVPVADLNGDGKPDFVALLSQEHETVVAFLNEGGGKFRQETIYSAPDPSYGSSSIQLVDLDGDGDLDVIYANGDGLSKPLLVRPYHGVHWLENQRKYPFAHHRLCDMPGVQRAVAADVDGDGDLDIVAVSYVPGGELPREALDLASVLLLEQTSKGKFARHRLETKTCDHFTCAVGDLFGTGFPSLVIGNFYSSTDLPIEHSVTIWNNLKRKK